MKEKTKTAEPANLAEEEEEVYLKYVVKDCTINVTIQDGGVFILQQGKPKDGPP